MMRWWLGAAVLLLPAMASAQNFGNIPPGYVIGNPSVTATKPAAPMPGSPMLDVRNYGAKSDGATDNTAAFQAANDAATTGGHAVIVIPDGNWKLNSTVTTTDGNSWLLLPGSTLSGSGVIVGQVMSMGGAMTNVVAPGVDFSVWGSMTYTAANPKGRSGILGVTINNAPASTWALPGGVNGYARTESAGNSAFGGYALGELYAASGVAVGQETTARNFSGGLPDTNLPPNTAIGTASRTVIGHNFSCGTVAPLKDCSLGINVTNETDNYADPVFNTGIWLGHFRQFGLFIDDMPSGAQTSAHIKNNGNGVPLFLQTTGTYQPSNSLMVALTAGGYALSLRQNGDLYQRGHSMFAQPTRPTLTACGTSPNVNSSNDQSGIVTTGSGTTSCTVNFASAFSATPSCTVTPEAGMPALLVQAKTSSLLTVAAISGGSIAGFNFDYHCFDQPAPMLAADEDLLGDAYRACQGQHETVVVGGRLVRKPTYKPGFEACADIAARMAARITEPVPWTQQDEDGRAKALLTKYLSQNP